MGATYIGRFAPSPTGPLHAGSLVAALASWLDARAHRGRWLVRIEDVDAPRCIPGVDQFILQQLAACGLLPDEAPQWQSQRSALYQSSLDKLVEAGRAYACSCSRKDVEAVWAARGMGRGRFAELVYPGTCRNGPTQPGRPHAWRLRVPGGAVDWLDRRLGPQQQDVAGAVGDFVLHRADGLWAYQLAVVVDDAAQGITHVVRGADLADNTARQIVLQRALGLSLLHYLHVPLVLGANGEKLSKQNGAQALDLTRPQAALNAAAQALGLAPAEAVSISDALAQWVVQWRDSYNPVRE